MDPSEIKRLLNQIFRRYGARNKGKRWLLENSETVCHVRLEINRRRPHEYDLPFWVFVRELWRGPILPEPIWDAPEWHLTGSRYTPEVQDAVELENCLNLKVDFPSDAARLERLEKICNEMVVPFLLEVRTVAGIRRARREGLLRGVLVHRELQAFLAVFVD